MVTPLEKFLAKHPTPSGMDSKEWAALNAAMKENKFFFQGGEYQIAGTAAQVD